MIGRERMSAIQVSSDLFGRRCGLCIAWAAILAWCPVAPAWGQCSPQELAKLIASDAAANDEFSFSVAVSGDTAVIGAVVGDAPGAADAGSAYVFTRSGGMWTEQAKLTASDAAANDQFGRSVAVSGDTAVVGAHQDGDAGGNSGSAYIFVKPPGGWSDMTETAKLTASDAAAGDHFGYSVAVYENTAIVGAWGDTHSFGTGAGSAYVFTRSGALWSQQAKLRVGPPTQHFVYFGRSVAIYADTVVVGAIGDDNAGGTDAGAAFVFTRSGTVWTQQAKLTASDAAANDNLGVSVAIDGDTAVVGGVGNRAAFNNSGSAYVFVKPGGGWTNMTETFNLVSSDTVDGDKFGWSVALAGDTALVGAYFNDGAAGSAYVFFRSGSVWTEQAKLTASDAAFNDQFGFSVAVSGDTTVVGAIADEHVGGNADGSAYVFDLLPTTVPGDMDGDHQVDSADTAIFVDVLLGLDTDPIHTGRADVDCSGAADGLDVKPFVDLLLN